MKCFLLLAVSFTCWAPPIPLNTPGVPWVRQRLFRALSQVENCRVWNNPGCLKYARQLGARIGPHGYAIFQTLRDGQRALWKRIGPSGVTVAHFLRRYNSRVGYAEWVAAVAKVRLEDVIR